MYGYPSQVVADEMIEKSPYADEPIFSEDILLLGDRLPMRQKIAGHIEDYRTEFDGDSSVSYFEQAEELDTDSKIHSVDKFCYGLSKVQMKSFPRPISSYWADLLSMYYQEFGKSVSPRYASLYSPGRSLHLIVALQIALGNKYASEKQTEELNLGRTLALNAIGNSEELDLEEPENQRRNGKAHLLFAETEHNIGGRKDRVERSMAAAAEQINRACGSGRDIRDFMALAHLYTQAADLASQGFDFGIPIEDAMRNAERYVGEASARTTDEDGNFRRFLAKDRKVLREVSRRTSFSH